MDTEDISEINEAFKACATTFQVLMNSGIDSGKIATGMAMVQGAILSGYSIAHKDAMLANLSDVINKVEVDTRNRRMEV